MATALPVTYPLTIYHGTTFFAQFQWKPDGTNGEDMTGWTAQMWITSPGFEPAATLSTDQEIDLTAEGYVTVQMQPAATRALKPDLYRYNLDLVDIGGTTTRLLHGTLTVVRDAEPQT